jgi:hypothetical protein
MQQDANTQDEKKDYSGCFKKSFATFKALKLI